MKSIYKILFLVVILLYGSITAEAQTRVITGIVSDVDGVLPGISVLEKGSPSNGVSTDVEGKFRITLLGNSNVLTLSGVGYISKEVNVAGQQTVAVTMALDSKGLEEVVVVGYGTQKKITVTSSISTITKEDIQQTPSASIQNALTGKLPGFFSQQRGGRPGADGADFFVRGVSTFNGSQSPLILVDDIEFTYTDFSNIDPNEVQSISILKDAAATAVYGIKGANGVILVTTRRGQVGAPRINFRTEFGLQAPTNIPKFLGSADVAMLRNEALKNDATISGGTYTPEFSDRDIELYRNGTDPFGHPDIDWYNTLFKRAAPINKNNLDISGGTDNVRYFVSLGFENQGGILRDFQLNDDVDNNYSFKRYNFRSNLDIKATKSLSFKVDFSGNNTVTNSPKFDGGSGSAETAAFAEIFDYEGGLTPFVYPIYNPDGSFGFTSPNRSQPANNIIGRIGYGGYTRDRQNLLNLNVSAIQKLDVLTEGLQAKILVSTTNSTMATRGLIRAKFPSFYYNPETGVYTPRDLDTYRVDPYSLTYNSGSPRRQTTVQASIDYKRSFNLNNVSALVLFNQNTKAISKYNYISENFRGLTSRVNYNYDNKYLAEFNGSYNGSDKFSVNKRFGFFPAGSVGWVISEEGFMKDKVGFINLFKIRSSYGIVGSDDLGNYKNAYEENFDRGKVYSFGETHTAFNSIVPGTLGNDNVSWEKERKFDIGIDFSMFQGRLNGMVDVFHNRRYDILSQRQTIASYFGVPDSKLPPENLGVVSNKGYEFELAYNGKIGEDFGYSFKGNYSFAKNKIVEIDEVPQKYAYKMQTGRSIGEIQGFVWDGFYSVAEAADPSVPKYIGSTTAAGGEGTTLPGFLKYRDLNGDGVITDDDKGYFGNPNLPNTVIGLSTGITYKRFSVNILLQSALNSDVQIGYSASVPFKSNLQAIHLKRWTPETGETAEFPTLVSNIHGTYMTAGNSSSFWAVSGNYLRIKSVELGYKLPERWVSKVGLQGVRVYANGYNLHTWSATYNRYGLDPEVARGGSEPGYKGIYPQSAIFNLGFNISIK